MWAKWLASLSHFLPSSNLGDGFLLPTAGTYPSPLEAQPINPITKTRIVKSQIGHHCDPNWAMTIFDFS